MRSRLGARRRLILGLAKAEHPGGTHYRHRTNDPVLGQDKDGASLAKLAQGAPLRQDAVQGPHGQAGGIWPSAHGLQRWIEESLVVGCIFDPGSHDGQQRRI